MQYIFNKFVCSLGCGRFWEHDLWWDVIRAGLVPPTQLRFLGAPQGPTLWPGGYAPLRNAPGKYRPRADQFFSCIARTFLLLVYVVFQIKLFCKIVPSLTPNFEGREYFYLESEKSVCCSFEIHTYEHFNSK